MIFGIEWGWASRDDLLRTEYVSKLVMIEYTNVSHELQQQNARYKYHEFFNTVAI